VLIRGLLYTQNLLRVTTLVVVLGELLTAIASIAMLTAPSSIALNVDYWMVRQSQSALTVGNKKAVDTQANDKETT
jgi:hypothetical protein